MPGIDDTETACNGYTTRGAHRAHRCFRAAAYKANHLHAGHGARDQLRQLQFQRVAHPVADALRCLLRNRAHHRRVPVPQNHRAPRAHIINVAVAIGVEQMRPRGALHNQRRAAHRLERPHRAIHPADKQFLRLLKNGV